MKATMLNCGGVGNSTRIECMLTRQAKQASDALRMQSTYRCLDFLLNSECADNKLNELYR